MKNKIFIFAIFFAFFSGVGGRASASEILCTLGTSATSTNCITAAGGFVAFVPSAEPSAGNYDTVQTVALSAEGATSIHYTSDGATPTCASGTVYSTPISVKKTQTIKAISCYPQNTQSAVASFQYLLSILDARTEHATLTAASAGGAALPTRATSVTLSNTTVLDVSGSVSDAAAGQVTVAGAAKSLASFTSGTLSAVNLSAPITVGNARVSIGKTVAIQSGVSGEPVRLSNQDFSTANVTIPDGAAVLAPSDWDGTIGPPKAVVASGAVPAGFAFKGSVVEVGSESETLLFDQPVSVILSGMGSVLAYKAGSSDVWVEIGNRCGGTYDTPSAPVFPTECSISNGTNTKIYTYHLTSFTFLESERSSTALSAGANGPAGFGAPLTAGDMNGDGSVDIFDFNILFAVWGVGASAGPFYAGADLSRDGKIDILDFNILMLNWK